MPNNAYESHRDTMRQSVAWKTDSGDCLSHFHSSIELLYMIEGSMTVILDGEEMLVRQGECLWCSSYLIHSYQGAGKRQCIVAIIPLTVVPMLSKMENGVCMPTPYQLSKLSQLYDCEPTDLINADLYLKNLKMLALNVMPWAVVLEIPLWALLRKIGILLQMQHLMKLQRCSVIIRLWISEKNSVQFV